MEDKYYVQIKEKVIDTEATIRVKDYSKNRIILENYLEIGRLLVEAQGGEERAKYGDQLIKKYSEKLTLDLNKKYSTTTLKYIRKFYLLQKGQPLADQLSWSHWIELLSLNDISEIKYYINISIKNNLSRNGLRERIKSNEYKNLSIDTKQKLIENKEPELIELVKNPIVIPNPQSVEVIKEKTLQKLIMENIYSFLKQLGSGYSFIGNEYPVKIEDRYYKIDLLLYNIEYERYVVIELKIGELKKEDIGQIHFYMNYIDKNKRKITQNSTIGIILCHKNNKLIMKYCSEPNIGIREYLLS